MALLLLISSVWYSYLLLTLANAVPIQNEAVILTVPIRQDYNWNITIGNPPQSFTVKLLISGVVSFVPSVQCNTDECMDHSRYDSSKSKTYKADGTKYETNSQELIRGFVSKDSICLSDICINEHPFVEATVVATWDGRIFFNENVDGILSIGISKSGIPTFLDKLFEQKKIPRKVVSIWHEWFSNTTGEVTIGGINEKRYDGTLNWTAFTSDNHWSMPMVKLDQIRSQNGTLGCKDRCDMIVTQELPIFGPTDEVEEINKYIGAKCGARCIVPCDQIAQLPEITFVLGETKLRLTGKDYIIRMRENYCQSAFMPFEADLWFIGEPIIRRYYTVFDFEKNLVGFANKKEF